MRRALKVAPAVLLGFALLAPVLAAAQDRTDEVAEALNEEFSRWKKRYAAPSYGAGVLWSRIRQDPIEGLITSGFEERKFPVFVADIRLQTGTHVTRRGGFYVGLETGALLFLPFSKGFSDSVDVDDSPDGSASYTDFRVQHEGGAVFLMSKYGYRFDTGPSLVGASLGLELGMGAGLFAGGTKLWIGDRDNPSGEFSTHRDDTALMILLEGSAEGAVRLGRNFRFFGKAGALVLTFPEQFWDEVYNP
ncbi:MAG: hypothetical protein ACOC8N_08625, partial [Spirochaetota bacterium]